MPLVYGKWSELFNFEGNHFVLKLAPHASVYFALLVHLGVRISISQALYRSSTPFPHHISVLQRGVACLVTCLRCGFVAAGTNVRLLERLVQDHRCKPAPEVTLYQEH